MHAGNKFHPLHLNVQAANMDGAKVILERFRNRIFACNLALDVTPECDCFEKTDLPIVPDIGIFASTDVVACDKATFEAIISAPGYPGSLLEGHEGMIPGGNKVSACHPKQSGWKEYEDFILKAGLGSLEYELVKV
jgi:uncharacterized Fe-S center protein